jgi:hypothetical protein
MTSGTPDLTLTWPAAASLAWKAASFGHCAAFGSAYCADSTFQERQLNKPLLTHSVSPFWLMVDSTEMSNGWLRSVPFLPKQPHRIRPDFNL